MTESKQSSHVKPSPSLKSSIKRIFASKFNVDVFWNLGSLAVLGVAGVLTNSVIAAYGGAQALGVFHQVGAIYIVLSQLSVGAMHLSVLHRVSQSQNDRTTCADLTVSALILCLVSSVGVCVVAFALRHVAGDALKSDGVSIGLGFAAPGLIFFSLNKVLMSVLNGVRSMRIYAVFQSLRFVFVLLAIVVIVGIARPAVELALALTFSELALFLLLVVYVNGRVFPLRLTHGVRAWHRKHFAFGMRGFPSGLLSEINLRVDVLMLGYFSGDAIVGVYSFAALLAAGLSQIPLAVRRNVDPILGQRFAEEMHESIHVMATKIRKAMFILMGGLALVAAGMYPFLLGVFVDPFAFAGSGVVFSILLVGIVLNSGYRPFLGVLLQGGRPGAHTWLILVTVGVNVGLNAALIPVLGFLGAAIATSVVYVCEAVGLFILACRLLGVRL